MRSKSIRMIAAATAVVMSLTAIPVTSASAASSQKRQTQVARDGITDISAHRRYRSRGDAAAIAGAVAIFGTIAALAAAKARRDRYRDRYHHGYRPYYGPGYYAPYAYGHRPYYGPYW